MDQLTSMSVFVRVVEKGSFTAAAAEFGISSTMVANHVRSLETHLGATLLERTTRRQYLTEIGAAYLERCREVLESVQAADQVAETLRVTPQGVLRVTASVSWGAHRLMPVIGEYMAAYPQVKVELSLNDRVVDMQEEGFDVAVRSGAISDQQLIARSLRSSGMLAVASRSYLESHARPRRPEDLRRHNCLGFTPWGHDHAWRFTRGEQKVSVPVRGSLVCNNGQALLTAALNGIGVVVQADVLLEPAIASGQLVQLLPGWDLPTRALHILRRQERRPTAKLRSFVDFVVERLG